MIKRFGSQLGVVFALVFSPVCLAQEPYAWKKLETEAYRGKQDDIYFVDDKK